MRFALFLLALSIVCFSASAWAEEATLGKQVIKTSFFTIELPERFVHVEGDESDWLGDIGGRFFANTKDYMPIANIISFGGSFIMLEYGTYTEGKKITEKKLLNDYFKNFNEEFHDKEIPPDDLKKFETPKVIEKNKFLTTAYSKIYFFDMERQLPMHGYSYATFFKNNNVAIWYAYFDSNNEETGRKAAQDIYEQIKKTSLELNPPKSSQLNKFNP